MDLYDNSETYVIREMPDVRYKIDVKDEPKVKIG